MVDKDVNVKLADFGLAKIIGEESFTTTLCGTPSYVAPEILADGRHRKYTKAVDIWSLGVVLYICLCGLLWVIFAQHSLLMHMAYFSFQEFNACIVF